MMMINIVGTALTSSLQVSKIAGFVRLNKILMTLSLLEIHSLLVLLALLVLNMVLFQLSLVLAAASSMSAKKAQASLKLTWMMTTVMALAPVVRAAGRRRWLPGVWPTYRSSPAPR